MLVELQQIGNFCCEDDELLLAQHQQRVKAYDDKQSRVPATPAPASSHPSLVPNSSPSATSSFFSSPAPPFATGLLPHMQHPTVPPLYGLVPPSPLSLYFESPQAPSVVPLFQSFQTPALPEQEEQEVRNAD